MTHFLHLAQTSWCHCGTPVSWTARGRQRSHKTQQHLHRYSVPWHFTSLPLFSYFLLFRHMIHLPLKLVLTRLQSSVLVLSLSSEMKIMLLLFFFFLLFLILTSTFVSPTVTTTSSVVLALMLPLERWRVQEVGDSGGRSLAECGKGMISKLKWLNVDRHMQVVLGWIFQVDQVVMIYMQFTLVAILIII